MSMVEFFVFLSIEDVNIWVEEKNIVVKLIN